MNPAEWDELDAQDMARLAGDHGAALNDLMGRHGERLFHYLVRCLQDDSDAADLAQETFVRVYQNRAKYDARQKFSTWLYSIATNLVRDRFRWRQRHPQVSLDAEDEQTGALKDALPDRVAPPSEQLDTNERAVAVREAIQSLPEDLRTPLVLSEYEDLPHAEIAAVLNCTTKAVESRLYRARAQLRKRLESFLVPD